MIQIKDLGTFEAVPEIVIDIVKGNIVALENTLGDGWDIHKPIQLGKYSEYSPLELALVMNCLPSVQWLVKHGADLNDDENPSFCCVCYGGGCHDSCIELLRIFIPTVIDHRQ